MAPSPELAFREPFSESLREPLCTKLIRIRHERRLGILAGALRRRRTSPLERHWPSSAVVEDVLERGRREDALGLRVQSPRWGWTVRRSPSNLQRMSRNEALRAAALALPEEERAELAVELIDSLEGAPDENAEEAWAEEVAARLAALRNGEAEVVPFAEAVAAAQARLKGRRG